MAAPQPHEAEGMSGAMSILDDNGPEPAAMIGRRRVRSWRPAGGGAGGSGATHGRRARFCVPRRSVGGPAIADGRSLFGDRSAGLGEGGDTPAPLTKILTCHVVGAEAMSDAIGKMITDDGGTHPVKTVGGCTLQAKMDSQKKM
jgi:hypothetical protein